MRAILQRVNFATVKVEGDIVGEIQKGLVVLLGLGCNDSSQTMDFMINKIINLRIFEDSDGKMNVSVKDINGGILIIPNFTLYGDAKRGTRPNFSATGGATPDVARELFKEFVIKTKELYNEELVQSGIFQADMKLLLENDGPINIIIDKD